MAYTRITNEIRTGQETFASIAANGYGDVVVSFTKPMSKAPAVCSIRSSVGTLGYDIQLGTLSVSKNGFTLRCWNFGNTAITPSISWIAVV